MCAQHASTHASLLTIGTTLSANHVALTTLLQNLDDLSADMENLRRDLSAAKPRLVLDLWKLGEGM